MTIVFNEQYLNLGHNAQAQAQEWLGRREWWINQEQNRAKSLHDSGDFATNSGIPTKDFFQEVDRVIQEVRFNDKFVFLNDLAGLATPMDIGKLSYVNITSGDINDNTQRGMDFGLLKQFDDISSATDKNPVPVFTDGVGMNYRKYMGLRSEGVDLMLQALKLKRVKMGWNIGDYMLNGDAGIVADGQVGQGIKNHRNTYQVQLGAAGANINLTSAAPDEVVSFFQQFMKTVCNDNVVTKIDKVYVSPEIMINLLQPLSNAAGFKEGSLLDQVLRFAPHIGSIEQDFAFKGNEFIGYVRDKEIISPLVALPLTSYMKTRLDPYENYNTCLVSAQGLKITSTQNGKKGVFYASAS